MTAHDVPQTSAEQRQNTGQLAPRRVRANPFPTHEVYFVQAVTLGLVKIGYAVRSADRLRTLQVGSPDRLELIGRIACQDPEAVERALHIRFRALRSHGEWFRGEPELLDYIREASTASAEETRQHLRRGLQAAHPAA